MECDFRDLLRLSEETTKKLWGNEDDEIWNKI